MSEQRVVIIGAGPAGIAAALHLADTPHCRVTLVERGLDLPDRVAAREGKLQPPDSISVNLEGFGGAGAFSDGKLTLTAEVGGHLAEIVGRDRAEALIAAADRTWLDYGAPARVYGSAEDVVEAQRRRAIMAGMRLVTVPLRHMGTDRSAAVLAAMRERIGATCELIPNAAVERIICRDGRAAGVELSDGRQLEADYIIAAPGRSGQPWFQAETRRLGLETEASPVDLGVRVEAPAAVLDCLTEHLYEFKLLYWSPTFDNLVRTFCVCPRGEVVTERLGDVITVNGHSYADRKTENTNFAILVSSRFTRPFDDPIAYGQYIARLANLLGKGVLVQRLSDLRAGRRSTPGRLEKCPISPTLTTAEPGDLSYVLPYRHLKATLEMIDAIDQIAPGLDGPSTLLYGVEVKLYSARVKVSNSLETQIPNLFTCGDGAGVTRGLMQASASGLAVAEEIASRVSAQG
ncbi:MAG: FAD-binding protein [Armatimonadetes bacterium]|nr:FAD-binding protein [Armatimonadota bacterium]